MMFAIRAIRHEDLLFRGRVLEELALAVREHSDDAIRKSFHVNRLVQCIATGEKCFAEVVADDGDILAVKILRFGEETADVRR